MNCAICGNENQPGTRFCVHCGAALSQVAAVPAMSGTALTSTTATTVRPWRCRLPRPPQPPRCRRARHLRRRLRRRSRAAEPAPSVPAYARPKKSGLLYVLIGAIGLIAVRSAHRLDDFRRRDRSGRDSLSRPETPSSAPSRQPRRPLQPHRRLPSRHRLRASLPRSPKRRPPTRRISTKASATDESKGISLDRPQARREGCTQGAYSSAAPPARKGPGRNAAGRANCARSPPGGTSGGGARCTAARRRPVDPVRGGAQEMPARGFHEPDHLRPARSPSLLRRAIGTRFRNVRAGYRTPTDSQPRARLTGRWPRRDRPVCSSVRRGPITCRRFALLLDLRRSAALSLIDARR